MEEGRGLDEGIENGLYVSANVMGEVVRRFTG